jgi:hypothetical protein
VGRSPPVHQFGGGDGMITDLLNDREMDRPCGGGAPISPRNPASTVPGSGNRLLPRGSTVRGLPLGGDISSRQLPRRPGSRGNGLGRYKVRARCWPAPARRIRSSPWDALCLGQRAPCGVTEIDIYCGASF